MGCSSALSLDIAKFYIPPFNDDSDVVLQNKRIVRLGKVTSVCAAGVALFMSTFEPFQAALLDIYAFQGGFLFQVFPAYVLGFFTREVCSWSVLLGLVAGIISIMVLEIGFKGESYGSMPHVWWSMIINFGMVAIGEGIIR